jgi:aconitate hydratase
MDNNEFKRRVVVGDRDYTIFDINELERRKLAEIRGLPFSIKILVENLLRKMDGRVVREEDLMHVARWKKSYHVPVEIPYHPSRVLMQDFTGGPAVVDLAAMRDAMRDLGGDPGLINPMVRVDLVVDHSVQVDYFGTVKALEENVAREYARNGERYELLKWAQKSFDNFRVVPPRSGICHQVNLEYLARTILTEQAGPETLAYPDTLVGTDSHTTMINSIGVMAWGVGGIEAEAVMLGQPYTMSIPEVIGVRMTGELRPGVTATDLVLRVTQLLRQYKVVEKFVEFFGPGIKNLTVPDRATVANMAPEYGATMGFFPVDEMTVEYLRMTDRAQDAAIVEACTRELGLFYDGGTDPEYTAVIEMDLGSIELAVAGPARPQDRIELKRLKESFAEVLGCVYEPDAALDQLSAFIDESGSRTRRARECVPVGQRFYDVTVNGRQARIGDGSVVIAAITSCTNTSNPHALLGAGLLARNAVRRGLTVPPHVKTSLAPGSRVVTDYLENAGLMPYLEGLGFHTVGFGCTTCIGNSGPLHPEIERIIRENGLNVAAVLSGNRNFEARIHQRIKSNFLASPMLVVAFALAGRVDVDLSREPVGIDPNGEPVYLDELWPPVEDIRTLIQTHLKSDLFAREYSRIFEGDEFWRGLEVEESTTFAWDDGSTYVKKPPFFAGLSREPDKVEDIRGARVLLVLGDSVTTDHISPAGAIAEDYPAGRYLVSQGVDAHSFNSYGSRRGNHEVMMRGTFGNIRIKNHLAGNREGSYTQKFPEGREMFVYDAAVAYAEERVPLIVLAGREYGTGSSRDWAAKGTRLLGVRAVIAQSFERIHRSNLVGMGVLPLVFKEGESLESLRLDGSETYSILGAQDIFPRKTLRVEAAKSNGSVIQFDVTARLDTDVDVAYFEHGGILPYVLRKILARGQ